MTLINAIILGIVQGLTEFLPISSSAHLVIIPELLNWEVQSTSFDIVLHAGSLFALIIFFWKDLFILIKSISRAGSPERSRREEQKLILLLIITAIPAGLVGFFFEDKIDDLFKSLSIIAIMLLAVGVIMIISDFIFKNNSNKIENLNFKGAVLIGTAQSLALIRGVSRSGITILGSQVVKLDRKNAVKFSFLASIPIMSAAFLKQLFDFAQQGFDEKISVLSIGFIVTFISSLAAIKLTIRIVEKFGLKYFGIYRIILAIVVLIFINYNV